MNAIYDAPRDQQGKEKYNLLDRKQPVNLTTEEQARLRFGYDGSHLAISVTDPFGALQRETILDYVRACVEGRPGFINQQLGKGGGGVGIFEIISTADLVVVNVEQGKRTEFISVINLGPGNRRPGVSSSFHFFEVKGPDRAA